MGFQYYPIGYCSCERSLLPLPIRHTINDVIIPGIRPIKGINSPFVELAYASGDNVFSKISFIHAIISKRIIYDVKKERMPNPIIIPENANLDCFIILRRGGIRATRETITLIVISETGQNKIPIGRSIIFLRLLTAQRLRLSRRPSASYLSILSEKPFPHFLIRNWRLGGRLQARVGLVSYNTLVPHFGQWVLPVPRIFPFSFPHSRQKMDEQLGQVNLRFEACLNVSSTSWEPEYMIVSPPGRLYTCSWQKLHVCPEVIAV
jgi:hypothetical protein